MSCDNEIDGGCPGGVIAATSYLKGGGILSVYRLPSSAWDDVPWPQLTIAESPIFEEGDQTADDITDGFLAATIVKDGNVGDTFVLCHADKTEAAPTLTPFLGVKSLSLHYNYTLDRIVMQGVAMIDGKVTAFICEGETVQLGDDVYVVMGCPVVVDEDLDTEGGLTCRFVSVDDNGKFTMQPVTQDAPADDEDAPPSFSDVGPTIEAWEWNHWQIIPKNESGFPVVVEVTRKGSRSGFYMPVPAIATQYKGLFRTDLDTDADDFFQPDWLRIPDIEPDDVSGSGSG